MQLEQRCIGMSRIITFSMYYFKFFVYFRVSNILRKILRVEFWFVIPIKNFFRDFRKSYGKITKNPNNFDNSMFRGHKFREYDTFTEILWNIESRKNFL